MTQKNKTHNSDSATIKPKFDVLRESGLVGPDSRWCAWVYRERTPGTKPAKVPVGAGGHPLNVTKPDAWLTFDQACEAFERGGVDGVGLLMASTADCVGLDLDGCLMVDGSVTGGRESLVSDFLALGGYVEVSPSGRGLRQFLRGERPRGFAENNGDGLEIYDSNSARYLTMTGAMLPDVGVRPVVANQAALDAFITKWGKRLDRATSSEFDDDSGFPVVERSADEIIAMMKQRSKRGAITKLLKGDIGDYAGASEADAALAFEVGYYSRDVETIEAVMRQSKLVRDKWDERRGKRTYLTMTIENALKAQRRNFDADQVAKGAAQDQKTETTAAVLEKGAANLVGGIADLVLPGGRVRNDVWAASELLLRDRRLMGAVFFDEFSGYAMLTRSLAEAFEDRTAPVTVGRFTDCHYRAVEVFLSREWGLCFRPGGVLPIVARWAQSVRRNPVVETLEAFKWDGKPRLDDWLIRYCGAEVETDDGADISGYVAAVGARWMLSAVARAMQPGCKADCMLVLEGSQGARKSSAVRVLAEALGGDYFREGFSVGASRSKDDLIALRGRLLIEWAELAGIGRRDSCEIKNFLTLAKDSYRDVFGMAEKDWPRTAIFCATTNESGYLRDATGNRRFWPVRVGRIDIDALRKDAPQLWGEAVTRYKAGCRWWFDDADPRDLKLLRMAEREQRNRLGAGYWDDYAAELADRLVAGTLPTDDGRLARDDQRFLVAQMRAWLAELVGGGAAGGVKFDDASWMKAADGLRRAGFESKKSHGRIVWFVAPERRDELRKKQMMCGFGGRSLGLAAQAEAAAQVAAQVVATAKVGAGFEG